MKKTTKRINIAIILLTVLCLSLIVVSQAKYDYAYAEELLDYNATVYIKNTEQGYSLFNLNGEAYNRTSNLESIISEIMTKSTNSSVSINFQIENNKENVNLNIALGKNLYFEGSFTSTINTGTVFILESGKLYFKGLVLTTYTQALSVNKAAEFYLNAGSILVNNANNGSAVEVKGTASIKGIIKYSESANYFGYGLSVDSEASVRVEDNAQIEGNSGILVNGDITINNGGGRIKANSSNTTGSGYALTLHGSGTGKIYAGKFETNNRNAIFLAGNSNCKLELYGGEFVDGIKIGRAESAPTLSMYNKNYKSTQNSDVIFQSTEGNLQIGVTEASNIIISAFSPNTLLNGYRTIGWAWEMSDESNGETQDTQITCADFNENTTIMPIDSNLYKIEFYNSEGEYLNEEGNLEFNTYYDFASNTTEKNGYKFWGWSLDLENNPDNAVKHLLIDKDYKVHSVTTLLPANIEEIENINTVYSKDSFHILKANLSHDLDVEYSYIWQKKVENDFEEIQDATSDNIIVKNHLDSGVYRVQVTTTYLSDSAISYSKEIMVTISKGSYENIIYPNEILGVYDKNKRLSSYALAENFMWANPNQIPTCDKTLYQAKYNEDFENFEDFLLEITLKLDKATYESAEHAGFQGVNYIYNPDKKLLDFPLDDNFYWENPNEVPTCGKKEYQAYYNEDKVNYENKDINIYIQLSKATYKSEKSQAIINTKFGGFDRGFSLAYLANNMPEGYQGYSFNIDNPIVMSKYELLPNKEGYFFENCIYNADPENYFDLPATITVFVAKADYVGITHDVLEGIYSPIQSLSSFSLSDNYTWVDSQIVPTCDVKSYLALYSDPSLIDYYNDLQLYIDINLAKGEYQLDDVKHLDLSGTYSPTQRLSDFSLRENYAWVDSLIIPSVDRKQYQAKYNADFINYNDFILEITINLGKASYDISGIIIPNKTVVYDGKEHYLEYQGTLPKGVTFIKYNGNEGNIESGNYIVTITLEQADKINYNLIKNNIRGTLTIEKAPSYIVAEERQSFVYDGTKKSITAYVTNSEQSLNYSRENAFREKGEYTIILSTTESNNYKAGQKEVKVFVNSKVKELGSPISKDTDRVGKVAFGTIENASGIESDVEVNMEYENVSNCDLPKKNSCVAVLKISLLLEGENYDYKDENYKLTVLMPKEIRQKDLSVAYLDSDGNFVPVSFHVNGNCMVIETTKLGYFVIEEVKKPLALWAWILIAISITLVIGTGIYLLYRFNEKTFKNNFKNNDIIESDEKLKIENEKKDDNA